MSDLGANPGTMVRPVMSRVDHDAGGSGRSGRSRGLGANDERLRMVTPLPSVLLPPCPAAYLSPRLTNRLPDGLSTRTHSAVHATRAATYSAGVGSEPICPA